MNVGPQHYITWDLGGNQKSSIFNLAYLDALLMCIFFHLHVYTIESIPFERVEAYHVFT